MVDPKTKRHQRVALGNISVAAKKERLCLFSTREGGSGICNLYGCRDKGDDFHEEARFTNGRGACSPEHRWLRAVCRQGQGPAAGCYQRVREGTAQWPVPLSF
jgi:hypothetical protein